MSSSVCSQFILGVRVDDLSLPDLLDSINSIIHEGHRAILANVNIQAMNIAFETPWFRQFLLSSEFVFCDGYGVKLGMFLAHKGIHHRYTPPDFIDEICKLACRNGYRIFFLGAREGVAEKAASRLRGKFPGLQIEAHHGFFDHARGSLENQKIVDAIASFGTNFLAVGMGMPLQERWISDNWEQLRVNIAFPAGALFDYVSGEQTRPPRWMTDYGFEWFGRLIIEPRRLWRRYIFGIPLFFWRVFVHDVLRVPLPE